MAIWNIRLNKGFILHTVDIGPFLPKKNQPILLEFPGNFPHSVWMPRSTKNIEISFFSASWRFLHRSILYGGANKPISEKDVVASPLPIKYILISPVGWTDHYEIIRGVEKEGSFFLELNNRKTQ